MTWTRDESANLRLGTREEHYISVLDPDYGSANVTYAGHATKTISSSRTGSKTDRWREKIRRHQNASSGLSAWKKTYTGGYGSDRVDFTDIRFIGGKNTPVPNYQSEDGYLVYVNIPSSFPTFSSDLDDLARAKVYKQAADAMTAFRSLTSLGEMRETLRMLRNPVKSLRFGMRDYFKRVTKRVRRAPKTTRRRIIAETYLEYAFGVAPLVNDIRSAGDALNRRLERYAGSYTRVSGTATEETFTHTPLAFSAGVNPVLKRSWGVNTLSRKSVRYYGEVRSVAPDPVSADMRLLGVTWADVALTGWELLPWSFVYDYFSNIGDVLESWSIRDVDWAWMASVSKRLVKVTTSNVQPLNNLVTSYSGYEPSYGFTRHLSCSPARATYSDVLRSTPLNGPGSMNFRFEVPGVGAKWLNLAALATSHRRAVRHVSS